MGKASLHEIIKDISFDISETINASSSVTVRESIPPNYNSGVASIANTGASLNNSGGIFMFSTVEDDATGMSDQFFQGKVAASGGASQSFENWRPKVFNKADDSLVSDGALGTARYSKVDLSSLYIDTATDEIVLVFDNPQSGARTITLNVNCKLFGHVDL